MKPDMKNPRVLNQFIKPRLVAVCLLICPLHNEGFNLKKKHSLFLFN